MNFFENENTEFKRKYVIDIKKTVVAFANSKGGTIYIGVSDDGQIIDVYVRQGNSSVPASEELIRQMIKEIDGDKFEEVRSFNQELTFDYANVNS